MKMKKLHLLLDTVSFYIKCRRVGVQDFVLSTKKNIRNAVCFLFISSCLLWFCSFCSLVLLLNCAS